MKVLNETAEEVEKTINSVSPRPAGGEERGEGGFFLTGVNVGDRNAENYDIDNANSD